MFSIITNVKHILEANNIMNTLDSNIRNLDNHVFIWHIKEINKGLFDKSDYNIITYHRFFYVLIIKY